MKSFKSLLLILVFTYVHNTLAREVPMGETISESVEQLSAKPIETPSDYKSRVVELKNKAQKIWNSYFGTTNEEKPKVLEVKKEDKSKQQVVELEKTMPSYKVEQKGYTREEHNQIKKQLSNTNAILETSKGRVGTSQLPLAPSGVPKFDFYDSKKEKTKSGKEKIVKIKKSKIPLLDIGEEPQLAFNEIASLTINVKKPSYETATILKEPKNYSNDEFKKVVSQKVIELAPFDENKIRKGLIEGFPVTQSVLDKIKLDVVIDNIVAERPVKHLSENEKLLLTALIINRDGKKCEQVLGLLDDLSKDKSLQREASYHLGICSQKLKFYSQAFHRLLDVIGKEDGELATPAIELLGKDVPNEYELKFTKVIEGLSNKSLIPQSAQDDVNYVLAKGNFKLKRYKNAEILAEKVSSNSSKYINARYLLGISQYSNAKGAESIKTFNELRDWMSKKAKTDKNVESLMAINIARIYFNIGDYKNSLIEYRKIGKDHPVWVQGLIEQGWAQVLTDDNSGAIGNMHSLHSPYFKAVFKPESYVVRTIGYLNICQYGDAYKSLHKMEQEHLPWLKSMDQYLSSKKDSSAYYETIKNYLRSRSTESIDGLPFQVIREMGRSRDFLNVQNSVNDKVDEGDRYSNVPREITKEIRDVNIKMSRAKERLAKLEANLNKAKLDASLARSVNEWMAHSRNERAIILGYKYQIKVLEKNKNLFIKFESKSIANLNKEKSVLRQKAGQAIGERLREMRKEVARYVENNELLRYEIFSGAGENIRYQVAGGGVESPNRIPANIKPTKILNWEFDGEYWEDEIGNYRSKAVDNCPQKGKLSTVFKAKGLANGQDSK